MATVANQVTQKFFEEAYIGQVSKPRVNNSWMADQILGEFKIEGAAPTPNNDAEEASNALMSLISFASRKVS